MTDGDAYRAVDRITGDVLWSLPDDWGSLAVRREGVVVHVAEDRVRAMGIPYTAVVTPSDLGVTD